MNINNKYPLERPNCVLYRKNGNNALFLYAYYDGEWLEIYKTEDDRESSVITIGESNVFRYSSKRRKPDVSEYCLHILTDVYDGRKKIVSEGTEYTDFTAEYEGE